MSQLTEQHEATGAPRLLHFVTKFPTDTKTMSEVSLNSYVRYRYKKVYIFGIKCSLKWFLQNNLFLSVLSFRIHKMDVTLYGCLCVVIYTSHRFVLNFNSNVSAVEPTSNSFGRPVCTILVARHLPSTCFERLNFHAAVIQLRTLSPSVDANDGMRKRSKWNKFDRCAQIMPYW